MNTHTHTTKNDTGVKASNSFFQPKLSVNIPGDSYEQEADAMADKVMRMKIPEKADTFFKPAISTIQRKCATCEEEGQVHRKETSGSDVQGSNELDKYVSTLSSSGQSLSESSRQFFEPRFGHDFSNVKVHTDSVAAKSAQSINALAYTTGNNIVFNQGQYSPNSESGQRLMAHELTHVVQQGQTEIQPKRIQRREAPYIKKITVHLTSPQTADMEWQGTPPPDAKGMDHFTVSSGKGYSNPGDPKDTCERDCCTDAKTQCAAPWSKPSKVGACCTFSGNDFWTGKPETEHNGWHWWTPIQPYYSQRGVALHQHTEVTGQPVSHGCVRMDEDNAKRIFDFSNRDKTKVNIDGVATPVDCAEERKCNAPKATPVTPVQRKHVNYTGSNQVRRKEIVGSETVQGANKLTPVVKQNTSSGLIQRFESWEHQDLGKSQGLHDYLLTPEGQEWAKKYGYNPAQLSSSIENDPFYNNPTIKTKNALITPSEAISLMGDYYKSWQDIWNAPAQEIGNARNRAEKDKSRGILDIADKERNNTISTATATNEYQRITNGRYLNLAEQNDDHFSPNNRIKWSAMHKEAIAKTKEKPHNNDIRDMAVLIDSAACHFLTDAFASGHLIDKEKILKEIRLYLIANPIKPKNPEMATIMAASAGSADQLILKIIHDHFNTIGFDVTNNKGMKWRMYGDGSLSKSPETQRIASLAVFSSRKQVLDAFNNISSDENEVLDLLPSIENLELANQQAIAYIPEASGHVEDMLLSSRFAAPSVFGHLVGPKIGSLAGAFIINDLDAIEDRAHGLKTPFPIGPAFSLTPRDRLQIGAGVGITASPDDEKSGVQAGGFLRGTF